MRGGAARLGSAIASALACACAGGGDPDVTTFGPSPQGPAPATSDEEESAGEEEDSFPDPDPIDTTAGWPDETTTLGDPSTSFGDETTTSGPPPDDSTTDDGGTMGDCPNLATCQGAAGIGLVSGDEGSEMIQTSGSEPTWIEFQVTETDDSLLGAAMSFTVTLTSPAGANFDLYVYRGMEGGSTGCNGLMQMSTNGGAQDAVAMNWGEGLVPNGIDDGVWVAVEIRAKDDMCAPPQEWTLTVLGNT